MVSGHNQRGHGGCNSEALIPERHWREKAKFFSFLLKIRRKLNLFLDQLPQELTAAFQMAFLDFILSLCECKEQQLATSIQE